MTENEVYEWNMGHTGLEKLRSWRLCENWKYGIWKMGQVKDWKTPYKIYFYTFFKHLWDSV
jgi:hypothetical protein